MTMVMHIAEKIKLNTPLSFQAMILNKGLMDKDTPQEQFLKFAK